MQKKIAIILGVIVLALAIGFIGSRWMGSPQGPEELVETPEERAARLGLGADVDADETETTTEVAPLDAAPLTGNEGQVVDGVRNLAPGEPARMENRDYFDGLEDLPAANPVKEKPADDKPAADTPAEKPAAPVVERPDDDLLKELDAIE